MNAICIAAAFIFTSCATQVYTNVTRFHKLPVSGAGETFAIRPADGAGAIESDTYANQISAHLERYGWRRTSVANAEYTVAFAYRMGGDRTVSGSVPILGPTGGGTTYHQGIASAYGSGGYATGTYSGTTYTPPTLGVIANVPVTRTEYDRFLSLSIKNRAGLNVYEVNCRSSGSSASIHQVLHQMIGAIFKEFPGSSGSSKTYTAPL